jgi:asparagine synthase (glutamine-hydrolysing)
MTRTTEGCSTVALGNSVDTRYPFLDEDFITFCSQLHPRWKLKGIRRDKHILRLLAARMLPAAISERPKAMFRAPFANTFFAAPPAYAEQLLSEASLRATGFFDPVKVNLHRKQYREYRGGKRLAIDMGLTGVLATQLWAHLFFGGGLCELTAWSAARPRDLTKSLLGPTAHAA